MNSIELTKEHRSKLLKMCKALFPEFKFKLLDFQHPLSNTGNENLNSDDIYNVLLDKNGTTVHWFEFCITHLSTKIFNKLTDFSNHMTADYEQEASYEWDAELMQRCSFFIANPTRMIDKYPDGKVVAWHPVDYLYEEFKKIKQ